MINLASLYLLEAQIISHLSDAKWWKNEHKYPRQRRFIYFDSPVGEQQSPVTLRLVFFDEQIELKVSNRSREEIDGQPEI